MEAHITDPAITGDREWASRELSITRGSTTELSYRYLAQAQHFLEIGDRTSFAASLCGAILTDPFNLSALIPACDILPYSVRRRHVRELIFFFRPKYQQFFHGTDENDQFKVGPYIRLLGHIASAAFSAGDFDDAVLALEEILRIRGLDRKSVEEALLCVYLTKIGDQRRNPHKFIRTWDHVTALAQYVSESSRAHMWINLLKLYDARDASWKEFAKSCLTESDVAFFLTESPNSSHIDIIVIHSWTDVLEDLMLLFGLPGEDVLALVTLTEHPTHQHLRTRAGIYGKMKVKEGIALFQENRFIEALQSLHSAINLFETANQSCSRDFVNADPAYFDLMAKLCAYFSWPFGARYGLKAGLATNPAKLEWYEGIRELYETLHVAELPKRVEDAINKGKEALNSGSKCFEVQKAAIASLSFEMILTSMSGKDLSDERWKALLDIGVEDQYAPISVPPNCLDPLPWLIDAPTEYDF